jgi:RsiW-degrading membrane proteinase PrsW (M82 family)
LGLLLCIVVLGLEAGRLHGLADTLAPAVPGAFDAAFVAWGPLIEEIEKIAAIVLAARITATALSVRSGIAIGLAVGVGFAAAEVGLYAAQAYADHQPDPIATVLAVRIAFGGFGLHAATAGLLGAAIGSRRSPATAMAMGLLALGTHMVWNLAGPSMFGATTGALVRLLDSYSPFVLWLASLPVAAILVAPATVAMVGAWRGGRRPG